MFEALLTLPIPGEPVEPAVDMIDVYEGSLPPSATFQTVDNGEEPAQEPTE